MPQQSLLNQAFDPEKKEHRELVQTQTRNLQVQLAGLKGNDKYMMGAVALATAGYFLPSFWVLPTKTMAVLGTGMAVHLFHCRGKVEQQYRQALQEAIKVYNWCYQDARLALRAPAVRELTRTLAPLLSKDELKQWKATDLIAQQFSDTNGVREQASHLLQRGRQVLGQQSQHYLPLHERVSDSYQSELKALADGLHLSSLDYRLYGHGQPSLGLEGVLANLAQRLPLLGAQAEQVVREAFMANVTP